MAEDWELKSIERRIGSLEKSIERDRKCVQEEKDKAWAKRGRRQERRIDISLAVFWTVYVAAMTTYIVRAPPGQLHPHYLVGLTTPVVSATGTACRGRGREGRVLIPF